MAITVLRESDNTKSIFVTPTYIDKDGNQLVAGSEKPFAVADVNHVRLHEGRAFYVYDLHGSSNKLANDANMDIAIAWATGKTPHLVFNVNCGGDAEFRIYENAVVTGGTSFTAINRYRSSANVSASAALIDPTVTSTGTALTGSFLAGGSGGQAGGANAYSFQYV
ncbi:hypothetical protein E3A20_07550, partial [Planctomyces bekefii]